MIIKVIKKINNKKPQQILQKLNRIQQNKLKHKILNKITMIIINNQK